MAEGLPEVDGEVDGVEQAVDKEDADKQRAEQLKAMDKMTDMVKLKQPSS